MANDADAGRLDYPSWHPKSIRDRTPVGKDSLERPLIPAEYTVEKFLMSTVRTIEGKRENKVFDISSFVHDFTITEELWSPTIMLRMRFRDNINLFNIMQLDGEERIYLEMVKKDWEDINKEYDPIKLNFVVYEYPSIETTEETLDVKYFTCIAISEFSYLSSLQRMSRSVGGHHGPGKSKKPTDNISLIFREFLNTEVKRTGNYECNTTFQGVLIDQQPLEAINYLLTKSFDKGTEDNEQNTESPFLLYNTIDPNSTSLTQKSDSNSSNHNIQLRSWNDIIDDRDENWFADMKNGSKPFILKRTFESAPDPEDANHEKYYDEVKRQITNLRSDLNISMLEDLIGGYFGTRQNIVTYAGQASTIEMEFEKATFQPASQRKYIDTTSSILKEMEETLVSTETINDAPGSNPFGFLSSKSSNEIFKSLSSTQQKVAIGPNDPLTNDAPPYGVIGASPRDLHIPSDLFATETGAQQAQDINTKTPGTYVYRHYFKSIVQTTQEITVFGDFRLNPGKHIRIWLPKNLNLTETSVDKDDQAKDEITSGEYIIAKTTHKFSHGGYMCALQLVRPTRSSKIASE